MAGIADLRLGSTDRGDHFGRGSIVLYDFKVRRARSDSRTWIDLSSSTIIQTREISDLGVAGWLGRPGQDKRQ
jgi:hypothetical protein